MALNGEWFTEIDPDGEPLSPALPVDPAPLGRALLAELTRHGPRTVTELRRYAVTETAYRAVDAVRALTDLLDSGHAYFANSYRVGEEAIERQDNIPFGNFFLNKLDQDINIFFFNIRELCR